MNDGAKRTQTWVAIKVPNLFILQESGTYYGRVKLEGTRLPEIAGDNLVQRRKGGAPRLAFGV